MRSYGSLQDDATAEGRRPVGAARAQAGRSLLAAALCLVGCSGSGTTNHHPFWQRARGDFRARIEVEGSESHLAPRAPGVIARTEAAGRLVSHGTSALQGFLYRLELRRDDGSSIAVHYRMGEGERLPFESGARLRVRVLQRRHVEDDGEDSALLIWLRSRGPASEDGLAARSERLVVVGQSRAIVGRDELPLVLHGGVATDVPVYYRTSVLGNDCEETHVHAWFRLANDVTARRALGFRHDLDARRFAPGSRITLSDRDDAWNVLLLENRLTVSSSCRLPSEPAWSFVAVAEAITSPTAARARLPTPVAPVAPSNASDPPRDR